MSTPPPTPPIDRIRNFSVVAHIDHGKSTLSDRLIQFTGGLTAREMREQVLDNMEIEQERGITIKAQTVRLNYRAKDGLDYVLNLMDTPGHVDFAYEVSRSLAACEGSILVVDASQGVEAQTLANVYQAIDNNHEIVPVLNKIDLPAAEPERVRQQIEDVIGIDASEAVLCSAKSGLGIEDVLEAIVPRLPAPKGDGDAPLKAMLVDAWYDPYLGVILLVRVFDGHLRTGQRIKFMQNGSTHLVDRVGVFLPKNTPVESLGPGEVGFITAQIKEVAHAAVGDTITDEKRPTDTPLKGLKYLLSALSEIRRTRDVRLIVIGKPQKNGAIEKLISDLLLGDAVQFTGRIPNEAFPHYYAQATLAVIPSLYEGFGMPAGEAMACGVPLISTTGGALPEVVGDAGVLVPPGDVAALVQAITTLLDHPQLRRQLGEAGLARVDHSLTWRHAAEKTVAVYREAIHAYRRL